MWENDTRQPPISILLETRPTEPVNVVCHVETTSVSEHLKRKFIFLRYRRFLQVYVIYRANREIIFSHMYVRFPF